MNEDIIDKLAKKAGAGVCCYDSMDVFEFAELIIQKCIKICEQQATMQFDAYHFNLVEHDTSEVADQCAKEIREHFGIKE